MVSKKKMLEQIQDLQKQLTEFTPTNTIAMEAQMEAKEAAIDSQVANNGLLSNIKYNDWLILNQWANYMANVFELKGDIKHRLFINRAQRYAFLFGYVWIWNNNGTPEIVGVSEKNGTPHVYVITEDFDISEKGEGYYRTLTDKCSIPTTYDKLIKYKFESLGYSAYITIRPIIKVEQLVSKALYSEILMLPTRLIQTSEKYEKNNKSARQIIEFNSPILFKYADGTDRFDGIDLAEVSSQLLQTIEYTKNYYYDILGRRTNSDYKKTHSLDSEIEAGQQTFNILERDRKIRLEMLLKEYNTLFKTDIIIVEEKEQFDEGEKEDDTIKH